MVKNDNSGSRQLSELWQYIRYLQSLLDREGIAYDAIFYPDSYLPVYQKDLQESTGEIVIASPVLTRRKVCSFIDHIKGLQEKKLTII